MASGGSASFAGLTLEHGGSGYTLQVNSSGLSGTSTSPLNVIPPPVTVVNVSMQKETTGKHKTTTVIVVHFDAALNAAAAQNLSAYSLTTIAQGKKHASKPVALAQSSYNPATNTVTLTPRKTLVLNPPLQFQINAAALTDTLGRTLDGKDNGQPGSNFVAMLSKGGVSIESSARFRSVKHHPHR